MLLCLVQKEFCTSVDVTETNSTFIPLLWWNKFLHPNLGYKYDAWQKWWICLHAYVSIAYMLPTISCFSCKSHSFLKFGWMWKTRMCVSVCDSYFSGIHLAAHSQPTVGCTRWWQTEELIQATDISMTNDFYELFFNTWCADFPPTRLWVRDRTMTQYINLRDQTSRNITTLCSMVGRQIQSHLVKKPCGAIIYRTYLDLNWA